MKISIIGSGWVGAMLGTTLTKNNEVIFFDISQKRIDELKSRGLNATPDIDYAINNSDLSFITVPTPEKNGKIDLSFIEKASEMIGNAIAKKPTYHIVVVKSTVVPGTSEDTVKPILEKYSLKQVGKDIGLCMNPEFLTQIHASWIDKEEFKRTPETEERIVIGEYDKRSGDLLERIYKHLNIPIIRTDLKTAEFVKYACNCCLASRISFWNEIFLICQKAGIDPNKIAEIASMDKRIGKYGTVHGKAFSGTCFPKDTKAFIHWSSQFEDPVMLKAVDKINEHMKKNYGTRE
ncbi:MAG: UDP-glucose/GDP-mannose dehydrogenase family protein [Candidatus Aenigmarchaeota archaeon]|nr:UDP-glucose/GDP-mannose dehydrogenase family protein [Candidatus Aenigmarchaeota archaeon]